MKLIYKNQKIKIFSLLLILAGIVSLGFFVQGCTEDALNNSNDDMSIQAKYLDLDVTNITTTAFTLEELHIIGQAALRITYHMVYDSESNKYVFDLQSPDKINVSERLFNYVYSNMNNIPVSETNFPRIKSDNYIESSVSSGWNGSYSWVDTKYTMNDQQMVNFFQSSISQAGDFSNATAGVAIGIGLTPGGQLPATGLGLYSLGVSMQQGTIQNDYNNYINTSNRTGGTVTVTYMTTSTGTCTLTTSMAQYNYTKK